MANIYDLKTVQQNVTDAAVDLAIGAVPNGRTRFITFLKMTATIADSTLTVSEGSNAITAVTTKDKQLLKTIGDTIMYPDSPKPEAPLFSLAGETYLVLAMDSGKTANVTIGYFDE